MNLLALKTEVLNRGFDPIQYGARIVQWINDAQMLVARRVDYNGEETNVNVVTAVGAPYFGLPADLARVRSLYDVNRNVEMAYCSIRDIDRSGPTNGAPAFYAITGVAIQLYPTPDNIYNLSLRYWKMPVTLAADADLPSLPVDWHHLLWVYATWMAFEADDDPQMGQYWQGRFNTELSMFTADQKFPDTDGPNQARGMWDAQPTLGGNGQWSLSGMGW